MSAAITIDAPSEKRNCADGRQYVLIVEDNKADLLLIRESLKHMHVDAELIVAGDGAKAITVLEEADRNPKAPCPDVVLLDINLPKRSGREVLYVLRRSERCAGARVIVVTSSGLQRDRDDMAGLGANEYFCKPCDYAEFMSLGEAVKRLLSKSPDTRPL